MKLTIFGGCGAWPAAGEACSGYLIEHDGFRLLMDPGYATLPRLLEHIDAEQVDAVLVSHGHPDHCADLNPLLRARALGERKVPALPVYALSGALDAVLALDKPGMLKDAHVLNAFAANGHFKTGPFDVKTFELPHFVPNVGIRLNAGKRALAYTGDTGPSPNIPHLTRGSDVLLAEATFPEKVPADSARWLSSARQAGQYATEAKVGRLVLTHLWPGADRSATRASARKTFAGRIDIARAGLVVDLR